MSTKILLTIIGFVFLAGCSKDKYTSKPQLTIKKINTKEVRRNDQLRFTLQVTDAEGDIQDSIWVQEIVRNCPQGGGTTRYAIPSFSSIKDLDGEITICYTYGINNDPNGNCPGLIEPRCVGRNDSATYRFWIRDAEKNVSDTVTSDEVVIIQQ